MDTKGYTGHEIGIYIYIYVYYIYYIIIYYIYTYKLKNNWYEYILGHITKLSKVIKTTSQHHFSVQVSGPGVALKSKMNLDERKMV